MATEQDDIYSTDNIDENTVNTTNTGNNDNNILTSTNFPQSSSQNYSNDMSSGPKNRIGTAQIVSYVLGGLSLLMLIVAVFLLILVRSRREVIVSVTGSLAPTPTPVPIAPIALTKISTGTNFQAIDFLNIVSPVITPTTTNTATPTVSPTTTLTPIPDPGDIPFDQTLSLPLQSPPEGYGFVAMTPDAQQWFTSFENSFAIFGQYVYNTDQSINSFQPYKTGYQGTDQNYIYFNNGSDCPNSESTAPATVNFEASMVGSVGYSSVAMSRDGVRLYIAYRQPFMGQGGADNAQIFPLLQMPGKIATFVRPLDTSGTSLTPRSVSPDWTYSCALSLQNPFGSQVGGLSQLCDPITRLILTGDDFGSIIRTSQNLQNLQRVVAARMNYGYSKTDGACIAVYEETANNVMVNSGNIFLFDGKTEFSLNEKLSFGKDFAVGDNAVLAAVRVPPGGGCNSSNPAAPPINRVAYFKRNDTTRIWEFQQFLETPDATEDFGVSIVVSPDGNMAIIGSPKYPSGRGTGATPGIGGSVYVYVRATDGNSYTLKQTVTDPFASVNTKGAFGYFLSTDFLFLVLSVSANQNNVLDIGLTKVGSLLDTDRPKVIFLSIDQIKQTILTSNPQMVEQPTNDANAFIDPCLGANLAMSFQDRDTGTLTIALNSPCNQLVAIKTMVR
jgi:hypothetical protein